MFRGNALPVFFGARVLGSLLCFNALTRFQLDSQLIMNLL